MRALNILLGSLIPKSSPKEKKNSKGEITSKTRWEKAYAEGYKFGLAGKDTKYRSPSYRQPKITAVAWESAFRAGTEKRLEPKLRKTE